MTVPPVYVISLARAANRRERMRAQLRGLKLPHTFVDAADGAALDLSEYADRLRADKWKFLRGRELSRGEIGCFLSHYRLWETLAENKTECAIVLEDDAILGDNFAEVATSAAAAGWHWDVILLSARKRYKVDCVLCELPHGRRLVRYGRRVGGAFAYLINLGGAKKLLGICRDISAPIDWRYAEWWLNGLEFYAVYPPVAMHNKQQPSMIGKPGRLRRGFGEYVLASMARFIYWQTRHIHRRMHPPRRKENKEARQTGK